jgi:YD repeat-containing protein
MNKKFLILFLLFLATRLNAQTVSFLYDSSGNRTSRTTTINLKSTADAQNSVNTEQFQDDIDENSITIFPNPVKSQLNVQISGLSDESKVKIFVFDQNGKLFQSLVQNLSATIIDFSNMLPGAYILIIQIDNKLSKWTIIKE